MFCKVVIWKKYIVARKMNVSCFCTNLVDLGKTASIFLFGAQTDFVEKHVIFSQNMFFEIFTKNTVYVIRLVNLCFDECFWRIMKYFYHFNFFWLGVFYWTAEGLSVPPIRPKLDSFPLFQTKETPSKGAVNRQYARSREQKLCLHQNVAGNHLRIVTKTQCSVEN